LKLSKKFKKKLTKEGVYVVIIVIVLTVDVRMVICSHSRSRYRAMVESYSTIPDKQSRRKRLCRRTRVRNRSFEAIGPNLAQLEVHKTLPGQHISICQATEYKWQIDKRVNFYDFRSYVPTDLSLNSDYVFHLLFKCYQTNM